MNKSSKTPEARMRELEYEMERHKARFMAASQKGIAAFRHDLSLATWVGSYPVHAAMIAFAGGLFLGITKSLDRREPHSLR